MRKVGKGVVCILLLHLSLIPHHPSVHADEQPVDPPPPPSDPPVVDPPAVDTDPPATETQTKPGEHHDDHHKENDVASKLKEDPFAIAKDVNHIREHLKSQYGFNDQQADQYLKEYDSQTQFFVMHDYDKNTMLDGLELLKSMTHDHSDHDEGDHHSDGEKDVDNTATLVEFVDMILKDQDYNNDGYIDYPEYINYYSKYDHSNRVV